MARQKLQRELDLRREVASARVELIHQQGWIDDATRDQLLEDAEGQALEQIDNIFIANLPPPGAVGGGGGGGFGGGQQQG